MVKAKDIRLVSTCNACPEQYDAYLGAELVGFLRLRWGAFTVTCPDPGGIQVYHREMGNSFQGLFHNTKQRKKELKKARNSIAKWIINGKNTNT